MAASCFTGTNRAIITPSIFESGPQERYERNCRQSSPEAPLCQRSRFLALSRGLWRLFQPLKQGRFLADGPSASFVRGAPLAAGRSRVISGVEPWSPDGEQV